MNQLDLPVAICRLIEPKLALIDCHCAITGSRVYGGGTGKNDIDIVIYPHAGRDGRVAQEDDVIFAALAEVFGDKLTFDANITYTHTVFKLNYLDHKVGFLLVP